VAVIGLGMAVTPHARSLVDLAEAGRVTVAGAWSRSPERRAAFAARFPSLPVTDDLDGLIADATVTAFLLVTPPNARAELVTRLAWAGKHVLAEKPVERTTAAAARIVEGCERAGVTLGPFSSTASARAPSGCAACWPRAPWARSPPSSSPSPGGGRSRATTTSPAAARWSATAAAFSSAKPSTRST
jgi:hypothetical protein